MYNICKEVAFITILPVEEVKLHNCSTYILQVLREVRVHCDVVHNLYVNPFTSNNHYFPSQCVILVNMLVMVVARLPGLFLVYAQSNIA